MEKYVKKEKAAQEFAELLCDFMFKRIFGSEENKDVLHEVEFRRLFSLARIVKFTPEEYRQYLNSLKHMSDYLNTIQTNYEKGLSKGREEGLMETARRMLAMDLPDEVISEATTLSLDQISAMK